MQRIDLDKIQADLTANPPQQNEWQSPTKSVTADNLPASHPMWTLWLRLSEMYPNQWASSQGSEPCTTWIKGLEDVSNDQLANGLRALVKSGEQWPPSLPVFRQLCLNEDPGQWERQAHKLYEPDRLLEDKTAKEAAHKAGESFFSNLPKFS